MFSMYISMFAFLVSIFLNRFISNFFLAKIDVKHFPSCYVLNFLWDFSLASRLLQFIHIKQLTKQYLGPL